MTELMVFNKSTDVPNLYSRMVENQPFHLALYVVNLLLCRRRKVDCLVQEGAHF
jgi:hypothetical protein